MRNIVKNLPLLRKALEGCHSQLLKIVGDVRSVLVYGKFDIRRTHPQLLSDERIDKIEQLVSSHLNEEGVTAKVRFSSLQVR